MSRFSTPEVSVRMKKFNKVLVATAVIGCAYLALKDRLPWSCIKVLRFHSHLTVPGDVVMEHCSVQWGLGEAADITAKVDSVPFATMEQEAQRMGFLPLETLDSTGYTVLKPFAGKKVHGWYDLEPSRNAGVRIVILIPRDRKLVLGVVL
jgi:hypothetical protein